VKLPRRDTRAPSPAGMFGRRVPLLLAAEKSRPRAPLAPMGSAHAYVFLKRGVTTRLGYVDNREYVGWLIAVVLTA